MLSSRQLIEFIVLDVELIREVGAGDVAQHLQAVAVVLGELLDILAIITGIHAAVGPKKL